MKFILGSGSPRRRELLQPLFGDIEIIPPHIDESIIHGEKPADYTLRIVNQKMDEVLSGKNEEALYLTSDTIVAIDGCILGKPLTRREAFSMLRLLSGREHSVITAVCIVYPAGGTFKKESAYEESAVLFKELSDESINRYLDIINYCDKAGSYAVQESGEMIIDSIKGSVTNVIGLPLGLLFRMIGNAGLTNSFF
ncbi:MAG TPA: Maf family protein [Spirochaetota bacterium]|nr:Maf family protein [Spirochaetota bacterium]